MLGFNRRKKTAPDGQRTVLFVGSFIEKTSNGTTGGQMFACKSLINSKLSDTTTWVRIDSTAEQPEKSLPIRTLHAAKRIMLVCYHLLTKNIDTTLIFTAHGASFLEKGTMCLIARVLGCKTIIAPRSGLITNDIQSSLRKKFIRLVFNKASLVVCQSPHWRSVFESVAPDASYTVIHNWIALKPVVNHSTKPIQKTESAQIEHKENHHSAAIQLFFLGWVTKDKGIFELLEAMSELSKTHKVMLHIGGHGDAFFEIEKLIKNKQLENVITLHGWVNEEQKADLFHKADIFVQPTHFEGFSNSVLEAMDAGVPIVCSNIPALASLLDHDTHCLHFDVKNSESLTNALERVITDAELRKTLANNASQHVNQQFSIDYGVNEFEKIL